MDEFGFIDSIKQEAYMQPSLIRGIGDDGAVFSSEAGKSFVTCIDTFVEGVHFSKETMQPFHVGYRALAANISDLAAMGAEPAFYLVSIVIPQSWEMKELSAIYAGMKELAKKYQMDLIGGDTVSGESLILSITVIGRADKGKARYRSDASVGDVVFVTGTLGDSQAGLHILTNQGEYRNSNYFIDRHRMPEPRIPFALGLKGLSRIALNDISDGVASETNEIAEASNVTIALNDEEIPISSDFVQFPKQLQHQWKYFGGEDFELLGTVREQDWEEVKRIAEKTNTRVSKIGRVTGGYKGHVLLKIDNKEERLEKKGYNHLSR
ncbi:thiamine-phosphate kinase [Oceanobacillus arenosus]|uniref:Thiamine-monophosphate kinase n=1 Tax=Oceanobacillus arenosus TaxID=1229153 RepID=A0A3D8PZ50_9BACI|nr:thiamine-phosphate kinase [Oceanobacillus arenosus]RDW20035.1 thiamine-phosphate kinase [Oceanobacillus arenosus]